MESLTDAEACNDSERSNGRTWMNKFSVGMLPSFGSMIEKAVNSHAENRDRLDVPRPETGGAELVEEWGFGRRISQCKSYVTTSAPGLAGSTRAHHIRINIGTDRVATTHKPSRRQAQGPGTASVSATPYGDAPRARSTLKAPRCVPADRKLVKASTRVLVIP